MRVESRRTVRATTGSARQGCGRTQKEIRLEGRFACRKRLADRVDDLFGEARELREELGTGVLESLDACVALLFASGRLVQALRLKDVDVGRVDPGHRARDHVAEIGIFD